MSDRLDDLLARGLAAQRAVDEAIADTFSVEATEPEFGAHVGVIALRTHPPEQCAGRACCIHNPSDHHMRSWRQLWRADRGLMERLCEHGIGHPDPDHMSYVRSINPDTVDGIHVDGIHGCDGCCRP